MSFSRIKPPHVTYYHSHDLRRGLSIVNECLKGCFWELDGRRFSASYETDIIYYLSHQQILMSARNVAITATSKPLVQIIMEVLLANATVDGMETEHIAQVRLRITSFYIC